MKTDAHYDADIAIVGGGIAGCTLAMLLAASYKVVLIDKLHEPVDRVGECLAPAARRILRKLSLLDDITQRNPAESLYLPGLGNRSYWGSDTLQIVDHLSNPDGLGWHLDRKAFEAHLRKQTMERNVRCLWGTKLGSCVYENDHWLLTVRSADEAAANDNSTIAAKFVVDAGGRLSGFAKQLGVKRIHFDKLVAHWTILPDSVESRMSTLSAAAMGWWYSAPLPGQKRVMALHTDPDLAGQRSAKDVDWFIEAIQDNKEMKQIAAAVHDQIEYRGVVAANSTRLRQVAGRQWAAIGDAAMSFDPLSAQGMFNAMAGAAQLAELMIAAGSLDDTAKTAPLEATYRLQMDNIWKHYLQHKNTFYAQEQRWKEEPFWRRRMEGLLYAV